MQKLNKIYENKNSIVIGWQKSDRADEYIVEGMNELFNYIPIARVKNCSYACDINSNIIAYRVLYITKNGAKDCIFDTTNMFIPQKTKLDNINIIVTKSIFDQVSLSFRTEKQYDLYRLYTQDGEFVCETEDCIIIGDFENKKYYVEGYMKTENGNELRAASEVTKCIPTQNIQNGAPLLSVIIPVYNSNMFLVRTVQSILSSTFNNFEIIIVDDGSNEETRKICDWYAENFDCIKTIHKENNGLSSARNRGVQEVRSEWISYIDSDDIVHPYMYEKLFDNAKLYNTNIAISQCIMREDYEKNVNVFRDHKKRNTIVMNSYKEIIEKRGWDESIYFTAVWNKIVKTDIVKKIFFDEDLKHYEDTAYTPALYSYIDKFVLVKDAYYIWDKRKRATVGTLSTKDHGQPPEIIWRDYIKACATTLKIGNPDEEIAKVYKYDTLKVLLRTYSEIKYTGVIKNIVAGMIKYYVTKYNLPTSEFLNSETDSKLYAFWQEIKNNNLPIYDGLDNIPNEYYL